MVMYSADKLKVKVFILLVIMYISDIRPAFGYKSYWLSDITEQGQWTLMFSLKAIWIFAQQHAYPCSFNKPLLEADALARHATLKDHTVRCNSKSVFYNIQHNRHHHLSTYSWASLTVCLRRVTIGNKWQSGTKFSRGQEAIEYPFQNQNVVL